jgi:alpha-beta hydrolase superfamily lysophospholipase
MRLAWILMCTAAFADDLPRHGVIGLVVSGTPPAVQRVAAGGAGEAAGFRNGDVIQAIDGRTVETADQFVRAIGRHLGGDAVQVTVTSGGARLVRTAVLKPRPLETSPNAEVLYRSVEVRGSRRRVIVTRPNLPGKLPAVLLMQGLGCYSLDGTDRSTGYGRVIGALEEKGFVTMRVEKTGEGDSEGPLCTDLSATPDLEADGWLAGLRALKQYDFVDPAKVFVFAHSMGPVVGSLVIAEEPVRGFIAVETVGTSWYEYDIERFRVQHSLRESPEAADAAVRDYEPCSHRFFVEKQRPDELLRTPACRAVISPFGVVPWTYMQAVADISLGRQWKGTGFPVLVIYGTASPVTTARQNQYLADLINRWRSGSARYVEIQGMSHDLNRYKSPGDYLDRAAAGGDGFHTGLLDVMLPWLEGLAR